MQKQLVGFSKIEEEAAIIKADIDNCGKQPATLYSTTQSLYCY